MPKQTNSVKKSTLYTCTAAALILGFLAGVYYSAMQTATSSQTQNTTDQHLIKNIQNLERQAKNSPHNAQIWTKLGHAYFDNDQPKKAIAAYQQVLKLTPDDMAIMTDMGVMYRRDEQPQKAVELFDQVLRLDPRQEQARFNKGVVLLQDLNNKEAALAEWKKLLAFNPKATTPAGDLLSEVIIQLEKPGDKKE